MKDTSAAALLALALAALPACGDPPGHRAIDRLDCNGCHAALYDLQASHAAMGYPRTCYACHGTASWARAVATHARFPIAAEPHAGYDCAECHLDTADATRITCIACHAHTEARTAPLHLGVGDFEYAPAACYRCHDGSRRPRG